MLKKGSRVIISDNSGGLVGEIISFPYGNSITRSISVGDIVKVAIKQATPNTAVKKGTIYKAIIVRTVQAEKTKDGIISSCGNNAVVLLNDNLTVIGTAVYGYVCRNAIMTKPNEVKKILSLAQGVY